MRWLPVVAGVACPQAFHDAVVFPGPKSLAAAEQALQQAGGPGAAQCEVEGTALIVRAAERAPSLVPLLVDACVLDGSAPSGFRFGDAPCAGAAGVPVDTPGPDGTTALMVASEAKNRPLVGFLLRRGASLVLVDTQGRPAEAGRWDLAFTPGLDGPSGQCLGQDLKPAPCPAGEAGTTGMCLLCGVGGPLVPNAERTACAACGWLYAADAGRTQCLVDPLQVTLLALALLLLLALGMVACCRAQLAQVAFLVGLRASSPRLVHLGLRHGATASGRGEQVLWYASEHGLSELALKALDEDGLEDGDVLEGLFGEHDDLLGGDQGPISLRLDALGQQNDYDVSDEAGHWLAAHNLAGDTPLEAARKRGHHAVACGLALRLGDAKSLTDAVEGAYLGGTVSHPLVREAIEQLVRVLRQNAQQALASNQIPAMEAALAEITYANVARLPEQRDLQVAVVRKRLADAQAAADSAADDDHEAARKLLKQAVMSAKAYDLKIRLGKEIEAASQRLAEIMHATRLQRLEDAMELQDEMAIKLALRSGALHGLEDHATFAELLAHLRLVKKVPPSFPVDYKSDQKHLLKSDISADPRVKRHFQALFDQSFKKVYTRDRKGTKVPEGLDVQRVVAVQNEENYVDYLTRRTEIAGTVGFLGLTRHALKTQGLDWSGIPGADEPLEAGLNENYLFHGTSPKAAEAITSGDFRVDLAGSNAGTLYGRGVYFAESCAKSDEYCEEIASGPDRGMRCILVCRVTLGSVNYTAEPWPKPDEMVASCTAPGAKFHSVLGDREKCRNTFKELMVYDDDQAYPAYIVWYKRRYP